MGDKAVNELEETMDEMEIMLGSLGDDPITLMDQYERASFEVQFNRAILGRSLSESCTRRTQAWTNHKLVFQPPTLMACEAHQGPKQRPPCRFGFRKVFERLLKPIVIRVSGRKEVPDAKDLKTWKAFSKSMRV